MSKFVCELEIIYLLFIIREFDSSLRWDVFLLLQGPS